jgi:hypothetical protein
MDMLAVDWGSDFNVATNSFKQVKIFGGLGHGMIFASLPELIDAAVTGRYHPSRWQRKSSGRGGQAPRGLARPPWPPVAGSTTASGDSERQQ